MAEFSRKIILTFRRKDFEEIYYKDNQGSLFLSPQLKADFIVTIVAAPLSIISILYFKEAGGTWFFPFLCTGTFATGLFIYLFKLRGVLKWRRSLSVFFKSLEKINHHELVITNEAVTLNEDESISIMKWENFRKADINEEFLFLSGNEGIMVPKKSVTATDYDYLKNIVALKMQGG